MYWLVFFILPNPPFMVWVAMASSPELERKKIFPESAVA